MPLILGGVYFVPFATIFAKRVHIIGCEVHFIIVILKEGDGLGSIIIENEGIVGAEKWICTASLKCEPEHCNICS